jgi:hypothetical protein
MVRTVSTDLSDYLGLGSMPADEMVVANGESENTDLREDRDELIDAVERIADLLDQADSLKQVSMPEDTSK